MHQHISLAMNDFIPPQGKTIERGSKDYLLKSTPNHHREQII
jgi:hypothetical protein